MDSKVFLDNINTKIYGKKLFLFDEIDSTSKYAMSELENKTFDEGTCFLALKQTAGIGTSGSIWESRKNTGMWLSIVLNHPLKKNPITFIPAIACARMLRECYNIKAHLKWPNDVLVRSKKLSGILVQAKSFSENKISYVIGIGLNIFQSESDFPDNIKHKATSLKIENPLIDYKLEDVYKNYMKYFEDVYRSDNNDVVDEWLSLSNMIGKTIKIYRENNTIMAEVLSITEEGYLKVLYTDSNKIDIIDGRYNTDIDTNY